MPSSVYIMTGAVLMAVAIALGAFGAHALKDMLEPPRLEVFHTAVLYQMIHSMGLILVGLLAAHKPSRLLDVAALLMVVGIVVFSGLLYAYVATQIRLIAMFVPIGGLSFIAAWLAVAAGAPGFK